MDPAVAGLIGALIGAIAGFSGTFVAHYLQTSHEQKKWLRQKKEEAYSQTIRYLLRSMNKRTNVTAEGVAILSQEGVKEFFTDLNEAQIWLMQLTIYCSKKYKPEIQKIADEFSHSYSRAIGYKESWERKKESQSEPDTATIQILALYGTYKAILEFAQNDLGKEIKTT